MIRSWWWLGLVPLAWPASGRAERDDALGALIVASAVPPDLRVVNGVVHNALLDVTVDGDSPGARAIDFLARFGELFGVDDPTSAVVDEVVVDGQSAHVWFRQRHQGYWVEHGNLGVHLVDDRVVGTSGRFVPDLGPVAAPQIEASRRGSRWTGRA